MFPVFFNQTNAAVVSESDPTLCICVKMTVGNHEDHANTRDLFCMTLMKYWRKMRKLSKESLNVAFLAFLCIETRDARVHNDKK